MALFGRHTSSPQPLTLNPRQVRRWAAALPLANMGETTRRFYQELLKINAQTASPAQRLVIMEILLPTAGLILTNIRRRLINQTFPLSHKTHKIYELQQSIALELSAAYRLVMDEARERSRRDRDRVLPLAIYRSMDFGIQRLFTAANLYVPDAPDSWQSVYDLYRIAEEQAVIRHTIRSLDKRTVTPGSIEQLFLRAVVLVTCQPRALHQGDSERLNLIFPELIAGCSIRHGPPEPAARPFCAVDLTSGMPPYHRILPTPADASSIRHVDLGPFVERLRELIESGPPPAPVADMARRLVERLSTVALRASERQAPHGKKMIVSFGLNDICQTLRQTKPVTEVVDAPEPNEGADGLALAPVAEGPDPSEHVLPAPAAQRTGDDWDIIARGCPIPADPPPPATAPTAGGDPDLCQLWEVIDTSEGGVRLESRGCKSSRAQVGELVALHHHRAEAAQDRWALGIVRWMFNPQPTHLEVGIQLLSSRIEVVGLEAAETPLRDAFSTLDGLLLYPPGSHEAEPTLIVPSGHFDAPMEVLVDLPGGEFHTSLREKVEHTASYERFRYVIAQELSAPAEGEEEARTEDAEWSEILDALAEDGQGPEQPDFHTVWSSL